MIFASPSQLIAVIACQAFSVRCEHFSVVLPDAAPWPQIIHPSDTLILPIYPSSASTRAATTLAGLDQVEVCSHPHLPGSEVGLLYNPHRKR